jgi:hypothetical protein
MRFIARPRVVFLKPRLLLTATIPPGATARVSTKPLAAFRPEGLLISPHRECQLMAALIGSSADNRVGRVS